MTKKTETPGRELRYTENPVMVEKREDDGSQVGVIEGYAAKFNQITTIGGWFREVVRPGFFDNVLTDDVRCLINHNPQYILARSVAGKGTLELFIDEVGLGYRYETPDISYAKDLQVSIERGDVNQSSFSFKAKKVQWTEQEGELELRELIECEKLFDVSPVTYPAYEGATVGKRSWEARLEEKSQRQQDEEKTERTTDGADRKKLNEYEARHMFNKNHS